MSSRSIRIVAMAAIFFLLTPSYCLAKLVLLPPDEMIRSSEVIAVATVTKRYVAGQNGGGPGSKQIGEFRLERVLKGNVGERFTVASSEAGKPGFFPQDIPERGTEVLVFLSRGSDGLLHFTSDDNNIVVIENDRVVDIYRGINSSSLSYVPVFNDFLQEANRTAGPGGERAALAEAHKLVESFLVVVVVILAVATVLPKRRRTPKPR